MYERLLFKQRETAYINGVQLDSVPPASNYTPAQQAQSCTAKTNRQTNKHKTNKSEIQAPKKLFMGKEERQISFKILNFFTGKHLTVNF